MVEKKTIDIWRDTPVRLLGYTNEVGESFRYVFPKGVVPSYCIAFAYVLADTQDKAMKQYRADGNKITRQLGISTLDCLVWQTLASVFVPGFVIHQFVKVAKIATQKTDRFGAKAKFIPVAVGLCAIPFIVKPIDHGVDLLLDHSLRKWS